MTEFRRAMDRVEPGLRPAEIGTISSLGNGIAEVSGLSSVGSEEVVEFPGSVTGIAINLEPERVGVILLGDSHELKAGLRVRATGRESDAPVGEALLGRIVDATGRPLDGGAELRSLERHPIERTAPTILERDPVTEPLETGIQVVDALIPVGLGQRELIVGDRQTGKTTIAVDTIMNQRAKGRICVYCAIGQRSTAVARVVDRLRTHRAFEHVVVVVASDQDPPGLRFITPYAATTMAEWFMNRGEDVLIVYDDLTRHARAYRELSLLLRRPPGREAYPGDIFYIHSRLLERSTHLTARRGGGSLTALPVVETQSQDISAYIPTNLISITDGQIYLSPSLFRRGVLPAVDVGRSVSRVGGQSQRAALKRVAANLRLAYAQFEELEIFARFATRLDEETLRIINHGKRVREILKQAPGDALTFSEQVCVLKALESGFFSSVPLSDISKAEATVRRTVAGAVPHLTTRIESGETVTSEMWEAFFETCRESLPAEWVDAPGDR
ncbi:MAG: F0F1 ATP synthase subunit alpha [Myxococcota bacterium]